MISLDKEHFYKIDGNFLSAINKLAISAENEEYCQVLIDAGKICELMKNYNFEEVN